VQTKNFTEHNLLFTDRSWKLRFILLIAIIAAVVFESTCAPTIDNSLIPNLDKMIHFGVFGVIAWLLASVLDAKLWFKRSSFKIVVFSFVFVVLLGVSDEYLQSFTSTRHAELNDALADLAGAFVMLVIWIFYKKDKAVGYENKGGVIS